MAPRGPDTAEAQAREGLGGHRDLSEIQRARIVAGATEVVAERGYGGLTVAEAIARAKISRRTFYELFADREECFLAAFDAALEQIAKPVLAAYETQRGWRERIGAALDALLEVLDERPDLGRLLVVDALAAGPAALRRRAAVMETLIDAVEQGSGANGRGRAPGPLAAEGVVGAVLGVLHTRLLDARQRKPLRALAGPLMSTIVLPYRGPAAAARELQRPVFPVAGSDRGRGRTRRGSHANPLHGLDMRLTYRTLRVLSVVATLPGASNRAVANRAGIADQGQMSKLLARLQRLGLIENAGRSNGEDFKGEPNRWTLTARGEGIVEAMPARPVPGAPSGR